MVVQLQQEVVEGHYSLEEGCLVVQNQYSGVDHRGGALGTVVGFFFLDKFKCFISVRAARICFLTMSEAASDALATRARLAKSKDKFACLSSFLDCAGNSSC